MPARRASTLSNPQRVLEALPDVVLILDADTLRILDVPRPAAFGWDRRELVRMQLGDLVPGFTTQLLDDALQGRHDPHPDTPLRVVCRRRDGREVPVDIRVARAEVDRIVAVLRQVSETARVAERELVTVVCAAPAALITWAPSGHVVSWNPAAERLYAISSADAIGSPIERIVPEGGRAAFRALCKRLIKEERIGPIETVRLRGGVEIEVEESLFLIRDVARHPIRLGGFARDVTELVRLRRATEILSRTDAAREETIEPASREVQDGVEVAARDRSATVLLLGETGVGKSWLARHIHARSPRAGRPFLEVNCASFEPQLMESELFGHERGAFTGAVAQKRGLVEVAEGGTLFLDEIGELPAGAQAKLLAFLDDRTFRRVGGTRNLTADVRLIAATNMDLEAAIAQKKFRKDLYYRLRVLPIEVPPLRQRRQEIPSLLQRMLRELGGRDDRVQVAGDALHALKRYDWPGNLREMRNALERAVLVAQGGTIGLSHLPPEIRDVAPGVADDDDERLEAAESRHIARVLAAHGGNRSHAARALGISRSTLLRKLGEWSAAK
jgi:PAS domain S-box-containing protein